VIWLLFVLLAVPAAWAENPSLPTNDQLNQFDTLLALLKECEGTVRDLQNKVAEMRRSPGTDTGNLSDLKKTHAEYKERCGELGQSLDGLRREARSAGRPPSRDFVELERRLMGLGQAERKLDGGLKLAEVEQQRRIETERRKTEADERRAQAEQKRKEDAARRETETNVRRLQQNLPGIINKGKEILDDK